MKLPHLRKPRPEFRLASLSLAQRHRLERWLFVENITYTQASARLLSEFGIQASRSAVSRFFDLVMQKRVAERALQTHLKEYAPDLHAALTRVS